MAPDLVRLLRDRRLMNGRVYLVDHVRRLRVLIVPRLDRRLAPMSADRGA
jgi:hypothetical protein